MYSVYNQVHVLFASLFRYSRSR